MFHSSTPCQQLVDESTKRHHERGYELREEIDSITTDKFNWHFLSLIFAAVSAPYPHTIDSCSMLLDGNRRITMLATRETDHEQQDALQNEEQTKK